MAAYRLGFGLSRLCSAGSGLLHPSVILHGPVTETCSSPGERWACRRANPPMRAYFKPLFKSCPLIPLASLRAEPKVRVNFNPLPTMIPKQVTWIRPRLMEQGCLPFPWRWRDSTEQSSNLQGEAKPWKDSGSALRSSPEQWLGLGSLGVSSQDSGFCSSSC